jgi:hypothetical protein
LRSPESVDDNRRYRDDEGSVEGHVFLSEDDSDGSKCDDCMDESQNDDEQIDEQDEIKYSGSEDEEMDTSENEGTLRY